MKTLIRWSKTLGLAGGIALTAILGGTFPAIALPQSQVIERLGATPIFFILSSDGKVVFVAGENNLRVSPRFLSRQDAERFLANLQQNNPQIANGARIAAVPLGEVYKNDQENPNQQQNVQFQFVPTTEQVNAAQSLTQQQFAGVPLFYATVGQENITLQQNGQTVIPFYFEKEGAMQMAERFRQTQPNRAANVEIKVVPLEALIETLRTSNDASLNQIVLIPSRDSLEFIQSVQQQVQQQRQQN